MKMKEEVLIGVYQKGGEFSFNGGPVRKASFTMPLAQMWVETRKPATLRFKIGRRAYRVDVKRETNA